MRHARNTGLIAVTLGLAVCGAARAQDLAAPGFTSAQAEAGAAAYALNCAACHGLELAGGPTGPTLKGRLFLLHWQDAPLGDLYGYIRSSMPPAAAVDIDDETYASILAFLLSENGVEAGDAALAADAAALASLAVPEPPAPAAGGGLGFGGLTEGAALPEWPAPPDRFADFTPLTEEMIADPAPENWLSWRRSHSGMGYSPLDQINAENVGELRVAWARSLPEGPNTGEPLVRDGVLYAYAYGDQVFAMDAVTGSVLWRYERHLPEGIFLTSKKTLALYGDKLFLATSDLHLVALDARTGRPVWDKLITDRPGFRNPGGPLAADGVVMQGLTTQAPGGGLIAAFDAETGDPLWTFNTIAQPGEPGGDTWNGLPAEARSGASVWTSGTYDAESGLAFWGTAQTYDTGPLRFRNEGENNDALFTDSTLAFDPHTGELVWYFQHMPNDQWDLDWVFDRVIGEIEVDGERRRVVITAGKEGLFDVLDAETGGYVRTVDMGLQDFVTRIDPETGEKFIDPDKLPGGLDHTITVCPNGGGGRNWSPTAFNPDTATIFVVARDVCMDMIPVEEGGFLSTHVNVTYAVPEGSDGRYGVMEALDMETGEIRWEHRQRAPFTSGVLATAGGLAFAGSLDGQFMAFDQATGEVVWRSGVSNTPNAAPISYAVDGKQYVALVVGHGNALSFGLGGLTPEIQNPVVNASAIHVFALPD